MIRSTLNKTKQNTPPPLSTKMANFIAIYNLGFIINLTFISKEIYQLESADTQRKKKKKKRKKKKKKEKEKKFNRIMFSFFIKENA